MTEADIAYMKAQLDLLWRLQNKAAMKREDRVKWLEQNDFKPNYTYLTLMCGCRRFRDDSKMPCHRHAGEPQAHPVMPNGKTMAEMADEAYAKNPIIEGGW